MFFVRTQNSFHLYCEIVMHMNVIFGGILYDCNLDGVSDITVEPSITEGQEVTVGTVFTCITNGRPTPTIKW
jgi:hypothetical protein